MASGRIEGWKKIADYFPCHISKFYRVFAKDMLATGHAIKTHDSRSASKKKPLIFSFEPLIFNYMSQLQIKNGKL